MLRFRLLLYPEGPRDRCKGRCNFTAGKRVKSSSDLSPQQVSQQRVKVSTEVFVTKLTKLNASYKSGRLTKCSRPRHQLPATVSHHIKYIPIPCISLHIPDDICFACLIFGYHSYISCRFTYFPTGFFFIS